MIDIDWFQLITGILGGLVFFLYGMDQMSTGFKSGLGDKIRTILTKLNSNRFTLMFTGILVTVITQSTGATTVMLLSFVETSIMQFAETVPVILGANIGSSVTSQIIAFNIAGYAIVPVIVGFFMKQMGGDRFRDSGNAIFGFGLVFFGMQFLGKSVSVLKDIPAFTEIISSVSNPLLGLLVGTVATCIMQSTGMFAGILMVFAHEGLIGTEQAYPMVIGSGIGTCLLIVIASVGTSTQSKRTMVAHVLTKLLGSLIFMCLIPLAVPFLEWIQQVSDSTPERQIATIHLFFNCGTAFTLIPFSSLLVKWIERLVPDKTSPDAVPHLRYIDNNVITMPQSAMELSISETATIIKLTSRMFQNALTPFIDFEPKNINLKRETEKQIADIDIKESKLDYIEEEVKKYLYAVGRRDITQSTTRQIFALLSVLEQTARVGEVVRRSLIPLYNKLSVLKITFSVEGMSEIKLYSWEISNHFKNLISGIENRSAKQLERVSQEIEQTKKNAEALRISHIKRLLSDDPNVRMTHEIHTELIDELADIASILSSITNSFHGSIIDGKE
ncbi:MAG: Na/Pi cotransporter family protein [Bacteroidales bacterium]|nr:Na/Pi cotransporter family protein [Bacteroidales bacterium]